MLRKKLFRHLLKTVRWTSFGAIAIGIRTTAVGFYGRERLGSTMNTKGRVAVYSQSAGWASVMKNH